MSRAEIRGVVGFFVSVLCVGFGLQASPNEEVLENVRVQTTTLSIRGLMEFAKIARQNGWETPMIRSKWAVDRLAVVGEKEQALADLELGRKIAMSLNAVEAEDHTKATNAREFNRAATLFAFSRWVSAGRGVGNALLARRAFDLALLPTGRVVIDQSTTSETLEELLAFFNPEWISAAYRARALNLDLASEIFNVDGATDESLEDKWQNGVLQNAETKYPDWRKATEGVLRMPESVYPKIPADELYAFRDDQPLSRPTTSQLMEGKFHAMIIAGLLPSRAKYVRDLIIFRRELGSFPTSAKANYIVPGLKGAFDAEWRAYYKKDKAKGLDDKVGLGAWYAYDELTNGRFYNDEHYGDP